MSSEVVTDYTDPTIQLEDGDYQIKILNYNIGYLSVRLMAQNIYTTQFATKAEVTSQINQKADSITASVNQTFSNYSTTSQMNSAIQLKSSEITFSVSETYATKDALNNNVTTLNSTITQTANNLQSQITNNDNDISSINQTINGVNIEVGKKYNTSDFTNAEITAKINDGTSNVQISANKISLAGKAINLTSDNIAISSNNFSVDKNGNMSCNNANVTGGNISLGDSGRSGGLINVYDNSDISTKTLLSSWGPTMYFRNKRMCYPVQIENAYDSNYGGIGYYFEDTNGTYTKIEPTEIVTPVVYQTSKKEDKKNFEKFNHALETIQNIDIYKYNLKIEEDGTKKHIGFVIGNDFNYSKEITSGKNDGVDIYSFVSLCCKAIQEQQQEIEELKKEIQELKGEK